ncbi:uncharacterized protein LOC133286856 [Gastrolobium bilobum]|uniref:uncharacterized protein LOC133286856 n=1 Tax=Gastrolobium bilobum TaxID=150636 RepID=UPI002AB1A767|nr:uncharacterized protein LOC133286856 [Gastrolobium bilobum]
MEEDEKSMSFEEGGYGYNFEELNTPPSSGAEEDEKVVNPKFNVHEEFGHVHLEVGMEFVSLQLFKNVVKDYSIDLGRQFKWLKNDKVRARAKCSNDECDWMIYCSWNNKMKAFQIKTFNNIHTCCRLFRNKRASRDCVAKKLEKRLMTQPNMTRAEAYDHMKEEYKVHVHLKKVNKALQKAKAKIEGCEKEQYAKLRDYLGELLRSNPGSTCQMQVIPQPYPNSSPIFSKLYICLDACKKGFKAGCRPLIGLDGCFLKGYYGGQLISAVGEDANKSFFVIAYAVVDSETKEIWKWDQLVPRSICQGPKRPSREIARDLIDPRIFKSGLIPALQEVMPGAYHRFCDAARLEEFHKAMERQGNSSHGLGVFKMHHCPPVPAMHGTVESKE